MSRQIGLLGGSFNPAHKGHLHVASTALKRLGLTEIWFVVARGNPLKPDQGDYDERSKSVARLIESNPRMKLCEVEFQKGLTYSVDTIRTLRHLHRKDKFIWIMGSDNLKSFHLWRDWKQIALDVPIAVIARPGSPPGKSVFERIFSKHRIPERSAGLLSKLQAPAWSYLKGPHHEESSSGIRNRDSTI
ncbi:MAG: nicotinate (nicotinamide) nucleotide adenylyltransferase [Pseudomonadota bacterium]